MNTPRVLTVLGLLIVVESGCSNIEPNQSASASGSSGAAGYAGTGLAAGGSSAGSYSSTVGGSAGSAGLSSLGGSGGSAGAGGNSGAAGNAGSGGAGGVDTTQAPAGWDLVWSDEFNGAVGDSLDKTKWAYSVGPNDANMEQEYYTDRPQNSGYDGQGHFLITSLHESYMGYQYTSAKFTTSGKYQVTYGRLETRIKLPTGKGLWPAFWNLGTNIGDVGWPGCGEMDIMETVGDQLTMNHGSLHGPGYSGGSDLTGTYTLPNKQQFDGDFHVFAAEWEENVVRFYVDDTLYETRTPADVPAGKKWVYDHDVFLILNVAVGGTWPGDPDNSIFPQSMAIDYVRVYQRPTQ
ncbi:MAG TPA: glycoside hydrolase family 16 protein [Polyangiaceae bacterium]|jgi:beta-glucanase (GH16 family)|nr:glycoside hydrolase family 16 protein [Polyangiaceae bacterium]